MSQPATPTHNDPARRHPQSGITNRPPNHNLFTTLSFAGPAANDPAQAQATLARLRDVVHRELRSDLDDENASTPKDQPGPETGELGFTDNYDRGHLTITLGLAKTGFQRLGVSDDDQPQDLTVIPWADIGDNPALTSDQGDLSLQICSDDLFVCEHVLRRTEEELGDSFTVNWAQLGTQRYTSRPGRVSRREARALIGFLDGTANLDPAHNSTDEELVFVNPDTVASYPPHPSAQPPGYSGSNPFPRGLPKAPPSREPEWTRKGTYQTVRASITATREWDRLSLGDQEQIIGRFKYSGSFLDLSDDPSRLQDPPTFAGDQASTVVALNAHARKANPRRADQHDELRRLFRRGYPLIIGNQAALLSRGLLFIGYARSISTQFEFIVRAWMRNPNFPHDGAGEDRLLAAALDKALCGGYYFVPALSDRTRPWTWVLPFDLAA